MMNKIIRILACTLFIALVGCADRNEDHLFDRVASDSFYNSPEDFAATVANVYQSLTGISFWYTMVQDNASDAIAIFQHADGWNNGRHHATASHELQASDTRFPIPNIWGVIFDGIAKANLALESLELAEDSDVKTEFIAECKVIRAYYYLLGMDVYGDMPLVTVARIDPQNLPTRKPRSEVFTFVERELLDAIAVLPTGMDENRFPRINREAARAVLATLYLNAEVYTGEGRWSDCITQCDFILGASGYGLAANYFDLFAVNNHQQAQEMIFYIDHDPAENTGGSIGMVRASLTQAWINENYPGFPYTVWNGPAVQPRFYRKYDTADLRYQNGFLEGVQFTQSGDTLRDESGNVVDHKIDFYLTMDDVPDGADYLGVNEGVRVIKWEPDMGAIDNDQGNGMPLIRVADIMLQKAECLLRLNGDDDGEAINLVNQVRVRSFEPDKPVSTLTLDDLYWERGFELFTEGHRRRDMIRFGTYHVDSLNGEFAIGHPKENSLFPIPQNQIDANPNLLPNNPTN